MALEGQTAKEIKDAGLLINNPNLDDLIVISNFSGVGDSKVIKYEDLVPVRYTFVTVGAVNANYITDGIDDNVQIQAAIDFVALSGGGTVYIRDGLYNISSPIIINIEKGLTLQGSGWNTILKAKNGLNDYVIKFDPSVVGSIWCTIRDFKIDGNNTNQTAGGGIYAKGAIESLFENLWIYRPYDYGIYLHEISSGNIGHNNRLVNLHFDGGSVSAGNGSGIFLEANDENLITGCDFQNMGGAGSEPYSIRDIAGLNIIQNNTFVGSKGAIYITNCSKTRILGNTFDGGRENNVHINGTTSEISVVGNTFFLTGDSGTANASSAVYLNSGSNHVVVGNSFRSHYTNGLTRSFVRIQGSGGNIVMGNSMMVDGTLGTGIIEDGTANNQISGNVGFSKTQIKIPNNGNTVGLDVTQGDTTNNPNAANVTNSGTGIALNISQTGNGKAIQITNTGNGDGIRLDQNTILAGGKQMFSIFTNVAHTNGDNHLIKLENLNTSTSQDSIRSVYAGTGRNVLLRNTGTGNTLMIEDVTTGTNSSIDIDKDGNNGGTITGLKVNVANAGAGVARAIWVEAGLTQLDGAVILNEAGADVDIRIEGDTDANLLFVDASTDRVGIGTSAPSSKLDINSDTLRLRTAKTPASASATGNVGDICWDNSFVYVCVATDTWKRAGIATW